MTKIHYINLKLSREIFTKYKAKFKEKLRVIDDSLRSKIYLIRVLKRGNSEDGGKQIKKF